VKIWALVLLAVAVQTRTVDRIVATVNGGAITELELNRAILTGAFEQEPGEEPAHFRQRVLSEMIDEQLRYRDALRFLPSLPDAAEIQKAMDQLVKRLKSEGKDPQAEFASAGLSEDAVRASLEKELIVTRYVRDRFSAPLFISPQEIQAEYAGPFSSELEKKGLPVPPLEQVEDQLSAEIRASKTEEEIQKWTRDLREKARIRILGDETPLGNRKPVVVTTIPPEKKP
jgi:hypothetical protein